MSNTDSLRHALLGDRLIEAFAFAMELHAEQVRKATPIPYISHLLGVCALDRGRRD